MIPIELTPSGRVATSRRLAKEAWGMQGLLRGCVNRGIRTAEDRVRGNRWRGGSSIHRGAMVGGRVGSCGLSLDAGNFRVDG